MFLMYFLVVFVKKYTKGTLMPSVKKHRKAKIALHKR